MVLSLVNVMIERQRAAIGVWQATDPEDFTKLFALYNSGTYNNQWMAIQLSQFQAGHPLPDSGIFWIIEQIPGFTKSGDVSDVLKKQGYWPSYNIPYFKQVSVFFSHTYPMYDKHIVSSIDRVPDLYDQRI